MKCRIHIFIIAILASVATSFAQSLRFEQVAHDFGVLAEDGGTRQCRFRYVNSSETPVVILRATTSCGCTTTEFSRKPIPAKGEGEVVVTFDPMNQPGRFSRKIVVHTSSGSTPLTISGNVTPRKRSDRELYSIDLGGGLAIDANSHAFGYVEHGRSSRSAFEIINFADHAITLRLTATESSGLLDVRYPSELKAGERATIDFGYAPTAERGVYGTVNDVLAVEVDGLRSRLPIVINAIIVDNREKFAESEPPSVQLSENFIKFGTLKCDSRCVTRRIKIENRGLSPLCVRKVECAEGAFKAHIEGSTVVASDSSTTLVVTLDPSKASMGAVVERLRLITDDPLSPMRTIKVSAIIEK